MIRLRIVTYLLLSFLIPFYLTTALCDFTAHQIGYYDEGLTAAQEVGR